jgi:hypothetical protein
VFKNNPFSILFRFKFHPNKQEQLGRGRGTNKQKKMQGNEGVIADEEFLPIGPLTNRPGIESPHSRHRSTAFA